MDEPSGVNFKQINFSHSSRWVIVPDNKLEAEDIIKSFKLAVSLVGTGYDYKGVISYFAPWGRKEEDPDKMWCSEADATAGLFEKTLVSPNEFFLMVHGRNNG